MTINQNQSFLPCMNYKQLQKFRQQVYELLNFAQDATFELMDAVLEQSRSKFQPLWLVWVGKEMPTLSEIWRLDLRRESC